MVIVEHPRELIREIEIVGKNVLQEVNVPLQLMDKPQMGDRAIQMTQETIHQTQNLQHLEEPRRLIPGTE